MEGKGRKGKKAQRKAGRLDYHNSRGKKGGKT